MGLMERIGRLFRSNVNSLAAQREDPGENSRTSRL